MRSRFVPNLFVLGAKKCATTTLYAYLDDLPDVCMARPKEPFFFYGQFDRGVDFFREQYFAHWRDEPVIGEAQHRNLYLPYVAPRIHQTNPDAKLIVLVRNPVERAFSHWYHNFARGFEPLEFNDALEADLERIRRGVRWDTRAEIEEIERYVAQHPDPGKHGIYRTYVESGYYYEQIERYLTLFPRDNLRVVLFEDLTERPRHVMQELIAFLGLDPKANRFRSAINANPALRPIRTDSARYQTFRVLQWVLYRTRARELFSAHARQTAREWLVPTIVGSEPSMDEASRSWLTAHYREQNAKLGVFLNRDLSAWG